MRNEVKYEWSVEVVDEYGDIVDSDFSDTLEALQTDRDLEEGQHIEICLIRAEGSEAGGLEFQVWAYLVDGKLPEVFSEAGENGLAPTGYNVPQRFHKEFEKYISNGIYK